MASFTPEQSGAFVATCSLASGAGGPLAGLRFAVKDLIDVAGFPTGCGNPTWLATHPPATVSAVCVELLLGAGARCVGKTVTDELAFSLVGENHFYGTPLNAAAPDRVPGGSSSGSASAVACGLADVALGTDTGGSVRFPASNCGLWGWRPSHGAVSVAGVMPFAPSFDTVGLLAANAAWLEQAALVLLGADASPAAPPERVWLLADGFELAEPATRLALQPTVDRLRALFAERVVDKTLAELCPADEGHQIDHWRTTFCTLQWAEIDSSLGSWIAATGPRFGPATSKNFDLVRGLDRGTIGSAARRRESYCRQLAASLGPRDLLCIPTTPAIAPLKGSLVQDRNGDYYRRSLSLTSLAGLGRLPQVSLPVAHLDGAPLGLSLLAARGNDAWLLATARRLGQACGASGSV